jgi:hypothetical protein
LTLKLSVGKLAINHDERENLKRFRKKENFLTSFATMYHQLVIMGSSHVSLYNWQLDSMPTNSKSAASAAAFGICFDVDGVIAHGTVAIPAAVEAFRRLTVEEEDSQEQMTSSDQQRRRRFRLPVNFVTNSLNRPADRVRLLSDLLGVQVSWMLAGIN